MPESRSRSGSSGRRYQLEPDRKKPKKKPSPKWYPPLVLGVMGLGVVVIVLNYMGILPFTGHQTKSIALLIGLGLIGVGFLGTTNIH